MRYLSKIKIVEAHDGDIFRTTETSLADGEKYSQGDHVIPGKNRSWTRNEPEQDHRLRITALLVESCFLDIFRSEFQVCFLQGTLETCKALPSIRQMQRTRYRCKFCVLKLKQTTSCVVSSKFII